MSLPTNIPTFIRKVVRYYYTQGRDLPWRKNITPYSIFISEIMLQQTQVSRVLTKYPEFLKIYPDFASLSSARLTDILRIWQGMGYNRRAKYLYESSKIICTTYKGIVPQEIQILESLPGIGPATAGSIACFAYNEPTIFIETNVRRSIIFHFFPHQDNIPDIQVRNVVESCIQYLKNKQSVTFREWYWALMDYGSYLKTVVDNPNKRSKHYIKQSKFEGSDRQIRGILLKQYLQSGKVKLLSKREKGIWKNLINEGLTGENITN